MRQKFEMNGDHVELILSYPGGDIMRVPLGSLLSMTTLNDDELARFSYQPPAPDPFDAESPLPDRVHCTIKVEVTPEPEVAEVLAMVEEEGETVQVILDPNAPAPDTIKGVTCAYCPRPYSTAEEMATHRRYAHPEPLRPAEVEGNTARLISDGTGPVVRHLSSLPTDAGAGHGDYEWRSGQ